MGGAVVGGRVVPEDFTSFVATYGRRLATACREIAGNDRVAEAMRIDLLAVVALQWRRWPTRGGSGVPSCGWTTCSGGRCEAFAWCRISHLARCG
jgi:hypothetical protein